MTSASHPLRRPALALGSTVLALGLLAACGDDDPKSDASDDTSASPSAETSPAADPSTDTSSAAPSTDDNAKVVPAYFVGDTPQGPRLYREFTQVDGTEPLPGAAAAITDGAPVDPDYRTLWPSGSFESVTLGDDAIEVALADDTWVGAGSLSKADARLAVQQLVYTLQGVAGKRLPITVTLDGKPTPTLLGIDASKGIKQAPELKISALVNVTEPADGATVSGTFTASGRSSSFEATIVWEIQDSDGNVLLEGSAMADGWFEKLYPWEVEIDATSLEPGTYIFEARTDDPTGGEGPGPHVDTKKIIIG